jgi:hypothetical protein
MRSDRRFFTTALSAKFSSEANKAECINSDNQDRNAREARLRPLLRVAIVVFGAASAGLARAVLVRSLALIQACGRPMLVLEDPGGTPRPQGRQAG